MEVEMRACNYCGSMNLNTGFTCLSCGRPTTEVAFDTTRTPDPATIANLADYRQPELLGAFEVYRQPDGTISATLLHMNERQIEARETIAERFEAAAEWLRKGAASLDGQAKEFPHDQ